MSERQAGPDYASAFAALPIPAALIDTEGIIVALNPAFLNLPCRGGESLRQEDWIGHPLADCAPAGEDRSRLRAFVEELLRTGQGQQTRWSCLDATGRPRHWHLRGEVLPEGGALILREEVTAQVRQEEQTQILAQVREAVCWMKGEGEIAEVLKAIWEGIERLEIRFQECEINLIDASADPPTLSVYTLNQSREWEKIQRPCPGDEVVRQIWQRREPCYRPDLACEDPYGEREYLERIYGHPVRSVLDLPFAEGTLALNSSEPDAFAPEEIAFLQELTQILEEGFRRWQDLRELEHSEREYRNLVEQSPIGISIWQKGQIVFANPAEEALTGYTQAELAALSGEEMAALIHPEDRPLVMGYFARRLKGEPLPSSYEVRLISKDGRVRWVSRNARLIQYQGKPAVQVMDLDITETKRLEQELIRMERLRALGELAAGLTHNLNNLLTTVLLPAQLLQGLLADPAALEEVETIIRSAQRASDLLRRFYLSVHGGEAESCQPISLNPLVQEVVEMTRPRWQDEAAARGIAIEVCTHLGEVPPIRGTESGVRDILVNLLSNAVDAMPAGGTIELTTQAAGQEVELTCRDAGIGMDEETQKRIFEPFFTTKAEIGSGLGLAAVHGLVAGWGGRIEVESKPGQGTTLAIYLPVWTGAVPAPEQEVSAPQPRPPRLLIAEDEEGIRQLLFRLLSPQYEVEVFPDGIQALERFAPGQYDAALLDLGMPNMPGDEVARRLVRRDPSLALVLITGWTLPLTDPRLKAFDFRLQKPFVSLEEVERVVAQAVALHRRRSRKRQDYP